MYQRDKAYKTRTLAFSSFADDQTELNEFYWAVASATNAVFGVTRHLSSPIDYQSKLGLQPQRFLQPLPLNVEGYGRTLKLGDEWHRRVTTLALASMFEKYVAAVSSIAIASDPLLQGSFPLVLDGLTLMRKSMAAPRVDLTNLTKGDWNSRLSAYKKLFGEVPQGLADEQGALEDLRKRRNRIAHGFASEASDSSLTVHGALLVGLGHQSSGPARISISEDKLVGWFGSIYRAAKAIDQHLLSKHVGGFELAAIYLEWDRDPAQYESNLGVQVWDPRRVRDDNARRFLNFVASPQGFGKDEFLSMKSQLETL